MAFWSSQTLATRLRDIVRPFRIDAIDCNALYALCWPRDLHHANP